MYSIAAFIYYLYFYNEKNAFLEKEMINRLKIVLAEEQKARSGWQKNQEKTELKSPSGWQIHAGILLNQKHLKNEGNRYYPTNNGNTLMHEFERVLDFIINKKRTVQ